MRFTWRFCYGCMGNRTIGSWLNLNQQMQLGGASPCATSSATPVFSDYQIPALCPHLHLSSAFKERKLIWMMGNSQFMNYDDQQHFSIFNIIYMHIYRFSYIILYYIILYHIILYYIILYFII